MNTSDLSRNACLLSGSQAKRGCMRWFHSFRGIQPQTGEQRVFFIEYMIMNPSLGGDKPILGQLPYNKKRGIRPSYLLLKAGAFAGGGGSEGVELHQFYPLTELKVALNPLIIQYGDQFYSEQHISGCVDVPYKDSHRKSHMTDEGQMEWDLEVHKSITCHTGHMADRFHSAFNALDSFWHGEGIKTQYRGTVILNGISYQITPQDSYGYADKHWGKGFNRPWLQLASCHFISERTGRELKHSALAIDGCCPRFLWFRLKRRLLLQLTYEGEDFVFNFSPFSKECKWNVKITNRRLVWQIIAQNKDAVIKVTVNSLKEQMMPLNYEDPDAKKPEGLYGGGSGCGKVLLYRRTAEGKELIDTLTAEDVLTLYEAGEH